MITAKKRISYTYFMLVSRENLIKTISKVFAFNLLGEEKIKSLVEESEVVFFKKGDLIYLEGAAAINFYVIYEGNVEIFVEEHQALRKLNTLHDGDYFGEDIFKQNSVRSSTARVIKDTLLVKITKKSIIDLMNENPGIVRAFSIIARTYTKLFDLKFRDLSQETVYFLGNPHYFGFISKIAISFLILLIPAIFIVILASNKLLSNSILIGACVLGAALLLFQVFWHYFEWQNDYYVMTGKRVINLTKRLFNFESKFEIPLSAINNLEIKKSFLAQNFGFGDLIIRTYTGETNLKNVPFVSEVQVFLELLMVKEKTLKKLDERKTFEKIVEKTFTSGNNDLEQSTVQIDLENGPNDMSINSSTIVLRTHWIILLKKILFPTLLIASIILLVIFFTANNLPIMNSSLAIVLVGIILIGTFLWWLFQFFDWWNDQYHITSDQIIDVFRRPFGTENRRTAPIMNIQSIRFERKGIIGLLLNFGTVYIRVGDDEFTFDNVHDPALIQEKLFGVLEMSISRMKKSEKTEQQQNLAELIETYHQIKEREAERKHN